MPRLPQPGKDAGQWGDILNEYLSTSLAADGSLKSDSVGAAQMRPNSVTHVALVSNAVHTENLLDKSVEESKLSLELQNTLSGKIDSSRIGEANGIAGLDADGHLDESQIPARLTESELQQFVDGVTNDTIAGFEGGVGAGSVGGSRLSVVSAIEKSRSSSFTVMLYGMSIAWNQASPAKVLGAMLQNQYGNPWNLDYQGFLLGGAYNNTFQGWRKQNTSGPGYGRARGGAGATALSYTFYGDTVVLEFSRELNAEAAAITIDGNSVGTSPAAGAQAFAVRQQYTVTRGMHTIAIAPASGSGYVYFERLRAYDSTLHGVHVVDNTLGGSTLGNMITAANPGSGQVDTIPTVAEAGVLAHFDRDDVDAFIIQQDVNDAGSAPLETYFDTTFQPLLNRIIQLTATRRKPLLLISSMAGHYSLPNKSGNTQAHINYQKIRAAYQSAALYNNHVTHIDWHAATAMSDLVAYAARYYPVVTGLDPLNGTWNGEDFIHPNQLGHTEAQQLIAKALGLPTPSRMGSNALKEDTMRVLPPAVTYAPQRSLIAGRSLSITSADGTTDTITTSTAHGLSINDRIVLDANITGVTGGKIYWVQAVPSSTTFRLSETQGGVLFDISASSTTTRTMYVLENRRYALPAGAAVMMDSNHTMRTVAYYRDSSIVLNRGATTASAIEVSATSDEFGKYIEYTTLQNPGLGQGFTDPGFEGIITVRARGNIEIRSSTATGLSVFGDPITSNTRLFNVNEPVVLSMRFRATAANQYLSFQGRIYEITITAGSVPVLI